MIVSVYPGRDLGIKYGIDHAAIPGAVYPVPVSWVWPHRGMCDWLHISQTFLHALAARDNAVRAAQSR